MSMAAQPGGGQPRPGTYATIEAGALRMAVDTRHVVQAIPWPTRLTPLPRSKGALEGVFSHRGQAVPLINLQRWLTPDVTAPLQPGQVLILRDSGKVMGLAIDAVRGLLRVASTDIHRIHQDDDPDEFFHSVALVGNTSSPVSLLDPVRLADRARAWATDLSALPQDNICEASATGNTGPDIKKAATPPYAVVRAGQILMGFAAEYVGEVLPMPKMQKMVGTGAQFLGMTVWRGRDVPVIDTHQSVGLPVASDEPSPLLVVLCAAGRCVGVPVKEVLAVRPVSASGIQPSVAVPPTHAALHLGTTVLEDGERVVLLDAKALIQSCALSALSQSDSEAGTQPALEKHAQTEGAHVVFRARQTLAAPLNQMQEIIRFPAQFKPAQDTGDGVLGTFEWRGQALPLLGLNSVGQQTAMAPSENTRVIVALANERLAGILVEEVVALIPAHSGDHTRFSIGNDTTVHMITLGQGDAQKSYRVLDFTALAFFAGS